MRDDTDCPVLPPVGDPARWGVPVATRLRWLDDPPCVPCEGRGVVVDEGTGWDAVCPECDGSGLFDWRDR